MKKNLIKKCAVAAAACAVIAAGVGYYYFFSSMSKDGETHYVYVDDDDNIDSVYTKLSDVSASHSLAAFKLLTNATSYASHVRTGRYAIEPSTGALQTFRHMRNGQQTPVNLTVPSVRTLDKLAAELSKRLMVDSADIAKALTSEATCEKYGYDTATIACMFIPNTYDIYWNTSVERLLDRMQKESKRFWEGDRTVKAQQMKLTPNEVITLASIVDEETAKAVCDSLDCPLLTYGISSKADLFARDIEITETGVSFTLNLRNLHAERVHLLLTGMFNVYNALAAAACALILGVELDAIKRGLEAVVSVPGRVLPTKTPYRMILDYSHSPDALENILKTVREFCHGRIILVFGCGGDRDKGKRPMMGEIAGRLADYAILTSDNPRFEDPMAILAAIEAGIKPTGAKYEVIENRREAIRQAMEMAVSGDIVVLAGKGHETYQEIRGVKHPFDEKVIVSELLEEIAGENRAE